MFVASQPCSNYLASLVLRLRSCESDLTSILFQGHSPSAMEKRQCKDRPRNVAAVQRRTSKPKSAIGMFPNILLLLVLLLSSLSISIVMSAIILVESSSRYSSREEVRHCEFWVL